MMENRSEATISDLGCRVDMLICIYIYTHTWYRGFRVLWWFRAFGFGALGMKISRAIVDTNNSCMTSVYCSTIYAPRYEVSPVIEVSSVVSKGLVGSLLEASASEWILSVLS